MTGMAALWNISAVDAVSASSVSAVHSIMHLPIRLCRYFVSVVLLALLSQNNVPRVIYKFIGSKVKYWHDN